MISLTAVIKPEHCMSRVVANNKVDIFKMLSILAARSLPNVKPSIFDALMARECLGSTGLGNGIAIPHCRLQTCLEPYGALLQLNEPIDFDSVDGEPVDLIFLLIVPLEARKEHLELLAKIASVLDRAFIREQLRHATDHNQLYEIMIADSADSPCA